MAKYTVQLIQPIGLIFAWKFSLGFNSGLLHYELLMQFPRNTSIPQFANTKEYVNIAM